MAPLFGRYSIQLWMPEAGDPVDFGAEGHEEVMLALGIQSKREITRTRIRVRVRTAMAAQAREQGRHLGGRCGASALASLTKPLDRRRQRPQCSAGAHWPGLASMSLHAGVLAARSAP